MTAACSSSAVQFSGCFPELFGFVLLDSVRLDRAVGGDTEGRDLLDLFTTTGHGDRVTHDGIAIPVLGVDAGDYTVLVRHAADRFRADLGQRFNLVDH